MCDESNSGSSVSASDGSPLSIDGLIEAEVCKEAHIKGEGDHKVNLFDYY